MTKTDTKEQKLYALLRRQWVSPIDALQKVGLMTLAQRVSEWRAQGIAVQDKWVTSPSGSRFKAYKIF